MQQVQFNKIHNNKQYYHKIKNKYYVKTYFYLVNNNIYII